MKILITTVRYKSLQKKKDYVVWVNCSEVVYLLELKFKYLKVFVYNFQVECKSLLQLYSQEFCLWWSFTFFLTYKFKSNKSGYYQPSVILSLILFAVDKQNTYL